MKAHVVGTARFRAPEVTMRQDYNESVDIFSAGVTLFIMLTKLFPFPKAVESKEGHYEKNKRYDLLLSDFNRYWKENIGYKTIVNQSAKQLILQMLAFNDKNRISINKIMEHEWIINGKTLANGVELQKHVESLLKQKSYFSGLKFSSPSITLTPLAIDEKEEHEHMLTLFTMKLPGETDTVLDTLKTCVENELNGATYQYETEHLLLCSVPGGTMNNKIVQFSAAMYLSRMWNSKRSLKRMNDSNKTLVLTKDIETESKSESKSDLHDMDAQSNPMVYVLTIREIDGKDTMLIPFKYKILKALETIDCKPFGEISVTSEWSKLMEQNSDKELDAASPRTHRQVSV